MEVSDALSDGKSERGADAESLLCEAVKAGRNDEAVAIIENIIRELKPVDDLLCAGLVCAVRYSNTSMVRDLLKGGANPEGEGNESLLFAAIEWIDLGIAELLLEAGADVNAADEEGHNVLLAAARSGRHEMVTMFIAREADVNLRSKDQKTILHHLAADKDPQWGMDIIDALLDAQAATDLQDRLGRTPLNWAVATAKVQLCAKFLTLSESRKANFQTVESRSKTSLHLAAAWGHDEIVELLLKHGADVNARADGSWTPLHTACEAGHRGVVEKLLAAGAAVDDRLLNGMTPLHCATQRGNFDTTEYLLQPKDISCHTRDMFGRTPFLLALQSRNKDVVELLAKTYAAANDNAVGASHGFHATIIDFGNFHGDTKVRKVTIHELLYRNSSIRPRSDAIKVYPNDDNSEFRWIHLPANNRDWVDHALRKALIEEGDQDVSSFISAERSLNQSHDGPYAHSQYMRAQSQTVDMTPASAAQFSHTSQANPDPNAGDAAETDLQKSHTPLTSMIYTYMPYVHFETEDRLQEMRMAIDRARNPCSQGPKRKAMTYDEMLIMGYSASKALHIRRTLGQVLHPNLNLELQRPHGGYQERSWTMDHTNMEADGANLFIVDQLWMWILGERLVITAFPQRWNQPRNEPYNVLDAIIQEVNTRRRQSPRTVFDLADYIIQQCTSSQAEIEMLDAMEQSISDAVMEESRLFDDFNAASAEATR